MSDVRVTNTTPILDDFASFSGSPIVIDDTKDIPYYVKGSTITPLQATAGKQYITTTAVLDFPSISANGVETLDVTLTGVTTNDVIMLGPPTGIESGLTFCAVVTSDNTVEVRVHNNNGGSTNPASATWRVSAFI